MIVDIGGGTTEVAVTSLGGIVLSSSLRSAGDEIDNAIIAYMKRKHNVLIGEMTAEMLKKNIGSVVPMADRGNMVIRGRNLLNGLPATLAVTSAEVREAMSEQVSRIVDCIRTTLENTPPELSSDIYDNGIMLAGGGALLSGLDILIQQLTGIRTMIAKNPMDCVAMGIGRVIDSVGELGGIVNFRTR
jgi:rod shape-determining protein MreB